MRLLKLAPSLLLLLLIALGCASFQPEVKGPQERYLAVLSDYTAVTEEATIAIDGWAAAIQAGDRTEKPT